jgi:hypothetical protein
MLEIIIISVLSAILIALSVIILSGKGDNLIAGYKSASKETRQQYDIKRLRLVVALMCLLPTFVCWVPFMTDNIFLILLCCPFLCVIFVVTGLLVINTWCKKKE